MAEECLLSGTESICRPVQEAGVQLVVPSGLHDSYPIAVRPHLLTLESFIGDVRLLNLPVS
ncbi:MAG: type II restriction endonuclease [Alphaproteobacteria bacterium]|nr:type II restriction endonuclease [Alphaproteobacteria bacterium]